MQPFFGHPGKELASMALMASKDTPMCPSHLSWKHGRGYGEQGMAGGKLS